MALSDLAKAQSDDERDLLAIIDDGIASSICFDNDADDGTGGDRTDNSVGDREIALEYYNGKMRDLPAEQNWSSAVSRDVADTIDQTMPGLMRVFAGTGQIVKYQAAKPGQEPQAQQATDYVNHVFWTECSGFELLFTAIMDAEQVRNGVIKVYWDKTPEYETEDFTGLDEEQVLLLLDDPSVDVIGHSQSVQVVADPATGQMAQLPVYDLRIRRTTATGRLMIECVPPEDFGISSEATSIDKARFVWERSRPTRSDLISQGYDRDDVDAVPAYTPSERSEDLRGTSMSSGPLGNKAMDMLEVYECYALVDMDGDGIAERRKIVVAGGAGARKLLSNEPWSEDLPYQDVRSLIVPHRWQGKSTADKVSDVQRVKTVLLRQMLNNLYQVNMPQKGVVQDAIVNPDELLTPTPGGVIRFNNGVDVRAALIDFVVPYIGDKALAGLQFMDAVITKRTGVSQATPALDQTALDPQTATAEQLEHDAGYASTELKARTLSAGLQALFRKVLRVIIRNQDRPRTIELRGKWVEFDPRDWNAAMTCSVQIGHGTGSRERDLNMLAGVSRQQDQIIGALGPNNPIVKPSQKVKTLHAMTEAAGLRDPQEYFSDVSDEDFARWQASQPARPDPAMAKVQAQIQGDQAKSAGQMQLGQQKAAADLEIAKAKLAQDYALKLKELELEGQLKAQQLAMQVHTANETQVAQPR